MSQTSKALQNKKVHLLHLPAFIKFSCLSYSSHRPGSFSAGTPALALGCSSPWMYFIYLSGTSFTLSSLYNLAVDFFFCWILCVIAGISSSALFWLLSWCLQGRWRPYYCKSHRGRSAWQKPSSRSVSALSLMPSDGATDEFTLRCKQIKMCKSRNFKLCYQSQFLSSPLFWFIKIFLKYRTKLQRLYRTNSVAERSQRGD